MKGLRPGWWLTALLSVLLGSPDPSAVASLASTRPAGSVAAAPAPAVHAPAPGTAESAEPSEPLADAPVYGAGGGGGLRGETFPAGLRRPPRPTPLRPGTVRGWHGLADLGTVPARPPPTLRP